MGEGIQRYSGLLSGLSLIRYICLKAESIYQSGVKERFSQAQRMIRKKYQQDKETRGPGMPLTSKTRN